MTTPTPPTSACPNRLARAIRILIGVALVAFAIWLIAHDALADGHIDTLTAWIALAAGGFGCFVVDAADVKTFGQLVVGWWRGQSSGANA